MTLPFAGLSAGGNLAAAVSLRLLDPEFQKLPSLRYQILLNPCLQGMDLNLPSYVENDLLTGSAVLSRRDMARFYLSYSGLDITPENIEQVWRSVLLFVCCVCVCVGVVSVIDRCVWFCILCVWVAGKMTVVARG